jgi:hypothetical protein
MRKLFIWMSCCYCKTTTDDLFILLLKLSDPAFIIVQAFQLFIQLCCGYQLGGVQFSLSQRVRRLVTYLLLTWNLYQHAYAAMWQALVKMAVLPCLLMPLIPKHHKRRMRLYQVQVCVLDMTITSTSRWPVGAALTMCVVQYVYTWSRWWSVDIGTWKSTIFHYED